MSLPGSSGPLRHVVYSPQCLVNGVSHCLHLLSVLDDRISNRRDHTNNQDGLRYHMSKYFAETNVDFFQTRNSCCDCLEVRAYLVPVDRVGLLWISVLATLRYHENRLGR